MLLGDIPFLEKRNPRFCMGNGGFRLDEIGTTPTLQAGLPTLVEALDQLHLLSPTQTSSAYSRFIVPTSARIITSCMTITAISPPTTYIIQSGIVGAGAGVDGGNAGDDDGAGAGGTSTCEEGGTTGVT